MSGNEIIAGALKITPWVVTKWFLVAGLLMYSFFALIVLRQTAIMTETFESDANAVVKAFAWMHLLLAIFLVVAAVVIL